MLPPRHLLMVRAALGVLALAATARAERELLARRADVGAELFVWHARGVGTVMPFTPYFHARLKPSLFFDLQLPGAVWFMEPEGRELAALGNPSLLLRYVGPASGNVAVVVGGGYAPRLPGNDLEATDAAARAAMAGGDAHHWAGPVMALAMHQLVVGVDARTMQSLDVRFEVRAAMLHLFAPILPTFVETRLDVEGWGGSGVGAGVQMGSSGSTLPDVEVRWRTYLEPYLSYDAGSWFGRLGLRMAAAPPLGPFYERGKVVAVHIAVGHRPNAPRGQRSNAPR